MHPNATAPAVPGGSQHLHPNASNRSDLLSKGPDEEDLDVNTDIYSKVMVTIIYLALFFVGTVGNSITAYTLVRKKSLQNLQSTVHYHLASLAFSDLLIFLLCMPIELYNFIWVHHPWAFGGSVCKGYYFLRDACTYATALNIASLSVERYMAICHPFKAKSIMSRSRTKKFISCIWIASFLLAIPMIFTMGEIYAKDQDPDSIICTTIVNTSTLKTVIQVRTPSSRDREAASFPELEKRKVCREKGGVGGGDEAGEPALGSGEAEQPRRDGTARDAGGQRGLGGGGMSAMFAVPHTDPALQHWAEHRGEPRSGVSPAPGWRSPLRAAVPAARTQLALSRSRALCPAPLGVARRDPQPFFAPPPLRLERDRQHQGK